MKYGISLKIWSFPKIVLSFISIVWIGFASYGLIDTYQSLGEIRSNLDVASLKDIVDAYLWVFLSFIIMPIIIRYSIFHSDSPMFGCTDIVYFFEQTDLGNLISVILSVISLLIVIGVLISIIPETDTSNIKQTVTVGVGSLIFDFFLLVNPLFGLPFFNYILSR